MNRTLVKCLCALVLVLAASCATPDPTPQRTQLLERTELPGGLVREHLRLPGFDPDEGVPAIAIHPASGGPFPVAIVLHYFQGRKEDFEPWCRDLAARGIFAIALDAHLHGERSIRGIFHGDDIAALGGEYSVWVHQSSIAHTVKDVPVVLDALARRPDVDISRVAVAGMSMGGSAAMVLAWREPRVGVVASLVGAVDFWWDVTKLPPGAEQEARKASYSPRLRELVGSLDPRAHIDRIPRNALESKRLTRGLARPADCCSHSPPAGRARPRVPPTYSGLGKAIWMANGGRDGYIDIQSVHRFTAELERAYGSDGSRLRFVPFPEAGHEVTAAMWQQAQDWVVRHLESAPSRAASGSVALP